MILFKVLNTLASDRNQQVDYLSKLGTFPSTDELALEFDDAYKAFLSSLNGKDNYTSINQTLLDNLTEIDALFTEMSNNKVSDFWITSSLSGVEWNKIRGLAKEALKYIDGLGVH